MTKGILFLFGLVLYVWGANLALGYVHVDKIVGTAHGVYHKGYTHAHTRKRSVCASRSACCKSGEYVS